MSERITRRQAIGTLIAAGVAGCMPDRLLSPSLSLATESVTLIGAGDPHAKTNIAMARLTGRQIQAALDTVPGARAFCVGDCTQDGKPEEFDLYDTTWGSFRDLTDFEIGNHDLHYDSVGGPYYDYVGNQAGQRGKGYYAKTYGAWRVIYLNSQQNRSEQTPWLANELATYAADYHIAAMWHQPQHASVCVMSATGKPMTYPGTLGTGPWWDLLVQHGAELVVSGHVHRYERLALMLRSGAVSPTGVRQFIVGTGGAGPMPILTLHPHNQAQFVGRGMFRLDLNADSYGWTFTDIHGAVRDEGEQACRT